jgi:16S rRNA (cytosine967-C5)-methyltransferase
VADDLRSGMDRVLVDAPCTGTGIWRRRPDSKWRLTRDAIVKRTAEQDSLLSEAAAFLRPGGMLTYATCSILCSENEDRVVAFVAQRPDFRVLPMREVWQGILPGVDLPETAAAGDFLRLSPRGTATDGFFVACVQRAA